MCLPVGRTDEGEGNELIPERVVFRYRLRAHQGLEAGVIRQVTDLAGVGSHIPWLFSATSHSLFSGHGTQSGGKK